MTKSIISDWKPEYARNFSDVSLLLHHRLSETGLFTKERLSQLVDVYPPEKYNITTMGYDVENPLWREGTKEGYSGSEVIESIGKRRKFLMSALLMMALRFMI